MKTNEAIYHETLCSAVTAALAHAAGNRAEVSEELVRDRYAVNYGITYGETRHASFEITALKGKKTSKFFHIVIYRLESGRYELTCYIS
jgi:hypothetical protein